jgi:hypothetical protein
MPVPIIGEKQLIDSNGWVGTESNHAGGTECRFISFFFYDTPRLFRFCCFCFES